MEKTSWVRCNCLGVICFISHRKQSLSQKEDSSLGAPCTLAFTDLSQCLQECARLLVWPSPMDRVGPAQPCVSLAPNAVSKSLNDSSCCYSSLPATLLTSCCQAVLWGTYAEIVTWLMNLSLDYCQEGWRYKLSNSRGVNGSGRMTSSPARALTRKRQEGH